MLPMKFSKSSALPSLKNSSAQFCGDGGEDNDYLGRIFSLLEKVA